MPNTITTPDRLNLTDGEILELLDWMPDNNTWCREYLLVQGRPRGVNWRSPSPQWIDWARDVLSTASSDQDHLALVASVLIAGETLHPVGMVRQRLTEACQALKCLRGLQHRDTEWMLQQAEREGVIRVEKVDRWVCGMPSGSGWRTLCNVTLYGKSLVFADPMPEPFDQAVEDSAQPIAPWRQSTPARISPPIQTAAPKSDIVWSAPFVDQQVQKFFRRHWGQYADAVKAVINGDIEMEQFGLDFGPTRITDWINGTLNVTDESRRCSKQNINNSATYEALVKSFKRNPQEHIVVKRIEHGGSEEVQSIIDELLLGVPA